MLWAIVRVRVCLCAAPTVVAKQVQTVGKPALGGSWSLVDMHGRPTTDADFRGQYILLYFGFTYCPDICPSELVKVGRVIDDLGAFAFSSNDKRALWWKYVTRDDHVLLAQLPRM